MGLYDWIFRHVTFPLLQVRRGEELLARVRRLREALELPPEQLRRLRFERLCEMLVHAGASCPFWTERFRSCGFDPASASSADDLRRLPALEKRDLQDHREALCSSAVPPEHRRESMTGGSTAAPTRFVRDLECLAWRRAVQQLSWEWVGKRHDDRWGLVWGASRDLGPQGGRRSRLRSRMLERMIVLPARDLGDDQLDAFLAEMERFRPKFLHGYAQAIHLLARRSGETGVGRVALAGITVTAEGLFEAQRRTIEQVFSTPVFDFYGTRECGIIAAERPGFRGMHINPLNAHVEVVRADGSPAPAGESGQVLVTDLLNRAMPLIRYRIGDMARSMAEDAPGGLGFARLEGLAGRETEWIVTPGGQRISGAALTLISAPGIRKLQFVQRHMEELTVRYVRDDLFADGSLDRLEQQLRGITAELRIRFEQVDDILPTESGKLRYVHSEIDRE